MNRPSLSFPLAGRKRFRTAAHQLAGAAKALSLLHTGGHQLGRAGGERRREWMMEAENAPVWRALCCLNMLLSSLASCPRGDFNFGSFQSVIACGFGETVLFSFQCKLSP